MPKKGFRNYVWGNTPEPSCEGVQWFIVHLLRFSPTGPSDPNSVPTALRSRGFVPHYRVLAINSPKAGYHNGFPTALRTGWSLRSALRIITGMLRRAKRTGRNPRNFLTALMASGGSPIRAIAHQIATGQACGAHQGPLARKEGVPFPP